MRLLFTILFICISFAALAQQKVDVRGKVLSSDNNQPVPFAYIMVDGADLWGVTDADGRFELHNLRQQDTRLNVRALGFEELAYDFLPKAEKEEIVLHLKVQNLTLNEVTITADRSGAAPSTYVIGRTALEHQQLTNIGSISQLLPGGKTISNAHNLAVADERLQLHSEQGEMGNAAFGTAIEIDGIRLNTNANAVETSSADLRGVSTANVAAVEVITGIASVEHGDLTSGLVKIRTKLGQTPLEAELSLSPNTKQVTLAKGVAFGENSGTFNLSYDYTRSTGDIASPHTSYVRSALDLRYANAFRFAESTLTLDLIAQGNIGGKDTKNDPDAIVDTYTRDNDRQIRLAANLRLLVQRKWLTSAEAQVSWTYDDKQKRERTNMSSASAQPQIHTRTTSYQMAELYDENPNASITLSPVGYWYATRIVDNCPSAFSAKLKATLDKGENNVRNNIMIGAEFMRTYNSGRGVFYEDMRYAPTWRSSRYFRRPPTYNLSFYGEDKLTMKFGEVELLLVAGLRSDHTISKNSQYGTATSISPRVNSKLTIVENGSGALRQLIIGGGWGKAVKLPSFRVLDPSQIYSDQLSFAAGTTADGTSFYAYHSQAFLPMYNKDLCWQSVNMTELNVQADLRGVKLMMSFYRNVTQNPYLELMNYTPYEFRYTSVSEAAECEILSENRRYSIDETSGVITVEDRTGNQATVQLEGEMRKRFFGQKYYGNGSKVVRQGVDFVLELPKIKVLNSTLRFDGKYYRYYSLDETLIQWTRPEYMTAQGKYFPYLGYYVGSQQTSISGEGSTAAVNSVDNGKKTNRLDVNAQITTHVPKVRLIVSVKVESTLLRSGQNLSEQSEGTRAFATSDPQEILTYDTDIYAGNKHVVAFPLYYSTIENPEERIPFLEKLEWAKQNDPAMYSDLRQLVLKTNTANYMNKRSVSPYCSANLRVTKELGDKATVSFYAINFLNTIRNVKETDTGLQRTLYGSTYVPQFYYGLSFKIKL